MLVRYEGKKQARRAADRINAQVLRVQPLRSVTGPNFVRCSEKTAPCGAGMVDTEGNTSPWRFATHASILEALRCWFYKEIYLIVVSTAFRKLIDPWVPFMRDIL